MVDPPGRGTLALAVQRSQLTENGGQGGWTTAEAWAVGDGPCPLESSAALPQGAAPTSPHGGLRFQDQLAQDFMECACSPPDG